MPPCSFKMNISTGVFEGINLHLKFLVLNLHLKFLSFFLVHWRFCGVCIFYLKHISPTVQSFYCWLWTSRLLTEAVARRCSVKRCSENFRKILRETTTLCNFLNCMILSQVFSCDFCDLFQCSFCVEHL